MTNPEAIARLFGGHVHTAPHEPTPSMVMDKILRDARGKNRINTPVDPLQTPESMDRLLRQGRLKGRARRGLPE